MYLVVYPIKSDNVLCIPYFPALVTREKQTAYDLLLGTHIIDK